MQTGGPFRAGRGQSRRGAQRASRGKAKASGNSTPDSPSRGHGDSRVFQGRSHPGTFFFIQSRVPRACRLVATGQENRLAARLHFNWPIVSIAGYHTTYLFMDCLSRVGHLARRGRQKLARLPRWDHPGWMMMMMRSQNRTGEGKTIERRGSISLTGEIQAD